MKELGIAIIYARSAQAKGRVERLWETLQNRLPIEFKLAGITTAKEANEFLIDYIPKFNSRFAVIPEDSKLAYRELADDLFLDHILCVKQTRTTDNSSVVSIHNRHFQILQTAALPEIPKRSKVSVIISTSVGVKVQCQGNVYEIINFIKPKKVNTPKSTAKPRTKYSPPDNHYFKYGKDKFKKVYFDDSYEVVCSPFFSYSANIRRIMYTTNIIENLNRQYRKVTKDKPIFPTDTALMKSLYLATENTTKKWSQRQRNWDQIINELSILHP